MYSQQCKQTHTAWSVMTDMLFGCLPPQVLLEFKEYATEVDVDFVRKAVRAIGYCAVSIPSAAERWVAGRQGGSWAGD